MHASDVRTELLESGHSSWNTGSRGLGLCVPLPCWVQKEECGASHEETRPAAVHPDLGVEGLIDVDPIVLAVRQGVGAPLPDEAGRRVGVDGTAQEHCLLLVEIASNIAHRLVHCQHGLVQVCKDTAPVESGPADPKAGGWVFWQPAGKAKPPSRDASREPDALPAHKLDHPLEAGEWT